MEEGGPVEMVLAPLTVFLPCPSAIALCSLNAGPTDACAGLPGLDPRWNHSGAESHGARDRAVNCRGREQAPGATPVARSRGAPEPQPGTAWHSPAERAGAGAPVGAAASPTGARRAQSRPPWLCRQIKTWFWLLL